MSNENNDESLSILDLFNEWGIPEDVMAKFIGKVHCANHHYFIQ